MEIGGGILSLLFICASMMLLSSSLQVAYAEDLVKITIDSQPRMSSILVDNVIYLPSQLPIEFNWEPDSTHTILIPSVSTYEGDSKRYDFEKWNDLSPNLSRTIKVTEDMPLKHLIAIFQTKYLLTIYSDYGSPTGAGWYNEGTTAELIIPTGEVYLETVPGTVRAVFTGWSTGYKQTSTKNYVEVIGPTVVLANWKEQYRLEVASALTTGSGSGWYDAGTIARVSVPVSIEFSDQGKKYIFREWQLVGEGKQELTDKTHESTEVLMDTSYTIVPQWNKMYLVSIDSQIGNPSPDGYYNPGDIAKITIDPIYESEAGKTRFIFSGWDGPKFADEKSSSLTIKVDAPIVMEPIWTKQYFIKVNSIYGMVEGSGWYDEGSPVVLKLQTRTLDTGIGKKVEFLGWSSDGTQSSSSQMDQYVIDSVRSSFEVTALWESDDTVQLVLILSAVLAVVATATFTFMFNRRRKPDIQQARGSPYNRGVGV